jgi:hypothetical protein
MPYEIQDNPFDEAQTNIIEQALISRERRVRNRKGRSNRI